MFDDPYKILGVSKDATDDEIKQAYRRLAKQYHPDRNPGDEAAAQKMQQINAAYEQIKNPAAYKQPGGSYGSYGGYGGYAQQADGDQYQQAAFQYLMFHRYREALNVLQNAANRDAWWYYLSALANNGIGNQITALEHIRRAVSMEPDNMEYLQALDAIENGGFAYRQQAGSFQGFGMRGGLWQLCMCWLCQIFCCRCC